jgi:hypothetical protein
VATLTTVVISTTVLLAVWENAGSEAISNKAERLVIESFIEKFLMIANKSGLEGLFSEAFCRKGKHRNRQMNHLPQNCPKGSSDFEIGMEVQLVIFNLASLSDQNLLRNHELRLSLLVARQLGCQQFLLKSHV